MSTPHEDPRRTAYVVKLERWKDGVINSLNPLRKGDDWSLWGLDLSDLNVAVMAVETLRQQRDTAIEIVAKLDMDNRMLKEACHQLNLKLEGK